MAAWECRDKEDLARDDYDKPLRKKAKSLERENMRLKQLLRENQICWSSASRAWLGGRKRTTRSSSAKKDLGNPHLPTEVILRILDFALTSDFPIIDPLSPATEANLTEVEKKRGNQIAIHFLATCRALHEEGTKIFWESNTFIFTTPQALRNLSELAVGLRQNITHVNFRIIARYYDDNPNPRKHKKLEKRYHRELKGDTRLRVQQRPREIPLVRGGFRSYAWTQIVDFLTGLRAPHDPSQKLCRRTPKPKLLPCLSSVRLDLVNFSDTHLPFSGPEFHDATSHEFGCTLDELQVTGMPEEDVGMKAAAELSGLLKDEGLYLDGEASYVAHLKGPLQALSGTSWTPRVVRALKEPEDEEESDWDMDPNTIFSRGHTKIGVMPPAPAEIGHPPSPFSEDRIIWKKVPVGRDLSEREWLVFWRNTGFEIDEADSDYMCGCDICGSPTCDCYDDSLDEDDEDAMMELGVL